MNETQKVRLKTPVKLVSRQTSPILILNSSNDTRKKPIDNTELSPFKREMTNLNIQRGISPSYSLKNENYENRKKSLDISADENDSEKIGEKEFPPTSRT
jgi:hypothetical protein